MRHAVSYMFLFAILYIASYLFAPIITDNTSATAAQFSSLESSNRVRKRSAQFEDQSFNHNFKQNNKVGKTRYYVSPAPVFQELNDNHGQTTTEPVQPIAYFYKIDMDSSPEPDVTSQFERSVNVTHIGCFATWTNQRSNFMDNDKEIYNENYTHLSCAEKCLKLDQNGYGQISFLKGAECRCGAIINFEAERIDRKYCNIPCPMKNYDPLALSKHSLKNPCGGNVGYSVYCTWAPGSPEDCKSALGKVNHAFSRKVEQTPTLNMTSHPQSWPVRERLCTVCEGQDCGRQHLFPDFDYFPVNSPQNCVEYCGSNVSWVHQSTGVKYREPTPFALLLWWKAGLKDSMLPMCTCATEDVRKNFQDVDGRRRLCDMPCPGNPNAICGGSEKNGSLYASIYCVGNLVNQKCETYSGDPAQSSTTTTSHPCDDPETDCDPMDEFPTTTETDEPTTTSSTTPTTTTISPPPTPPPTVTTTTTSTTASTTTTSTPKTTSATTIPCKQCKATDIYGNDWNACVSTIAHMNCSKLFPDYQGNASWKCDANGNFVTPSPNISECNPNWLRDKFKEIDNVTNLKEANTFIERLAENCKNAQHDTNVYQGHNIKDITGLIGLTMEKVIHNNFTSSTDSLRQIVRNAVDLNAFLMQFHGPWQDLSSNEKSSLSNNLIENTEDILFHLTGSSQASSQLVLHNVTGVSKFLVFAETFNKVANKTLTNNYEFPVQSFRDESDYSYLKLPNGWQHNLPSDKVEIAAMSVDSQYISFIMPGQYENLKSASNVQNGDTKLINGRLISFTIKTQGSKVAKKGSTLQNQLGLFTGEGVKIIIQHDIEAWGDQAHAIPRKLHSGEKPKAVLANTKCAFWDVKKLEWSSEGCKIVTNNRYETVCECNHLTSFAVLMDIHRYVGKQLALEILTLILCPLSEIALLLSIIILSSVNGIQKIRATITKNLCICLFVGNALVMIVLDKNYVHMSESLCTASAIVTHYVFLAAFMWMLIEGVQLYRMVVHVFDSGRSYIKHFGVFAYGFPMILVASTATIGYLKGDRPYGGDVFCWLEGPYIWSFLAPIAIIIMVNLIILFIALKTAYQVQQNKKLSPNFLIGRMRGYRTWFKGCFSLTVILGLTWVVGFFTLMKAPGGVVAAYIFTLLNASQGIFIFVYHCVFNDKVRSLTRRNLSTYLPSWLTSSVSSNPGVNEASTYGKRPLSSMKTGESALNNKHRKLSSNPNHVNKPHEVKNAYVISNMKAQNQLTLDQDWIMKHPRQDFLSAKNAYVESTHPTVIPAQRCESVGTISSVDSIPNSAGSDNGHMSSDNSHKALISKNF